MTIRTSASDDQDGFFSPTSAYDDKNNHRDDDNDSAGKDAKFDGERGTMFQQSTLAATPTPSTAPDECLPLMVSLVLPVTNLITPWSESCFSFVSSDCRLLQCPKPGLLRDKMVNTDSPS